MSKHSIKRSGTMFINKTEDGKNNACGGRVSELRKQLNISQWELADRLQISGLDIDKNAIQRIEAGKRFVTDIEIVYLANIFNVSCNYLITGKE